MAFCGKYLVSENFNPFNGALLNGDAVSVCFFVRSAKMILSEEVYFFLMASMRKMRFSIPANYTLDFFESLFSEHVINKNIDNAVIRFMVTRSRSSIALQKSSVEYCFEVIETEDVLKIRNRAELDIIKEISVNTNLLSNIRTHCPENIYAEIYATENELDDVILLNPQKRIARTVSGNLLLLTENKLRVVKHSEGSYISPLLESFVTFVHKTGLAVLEEAEIIAFETQKADEILLISDEKGIFSIEKIRNKTFPSVRFAELISKWQESFSR